MFTGGRGTGRITEALMRHGQTDLTLLVNTYDDGLSTGALRRFIPGMLGPSDVRKNVSRLIDTTDRSSRAIQTLIEYRFPDPMDTRAALLQLRGLASGVGGGLAETLQRCLDDMSWNDHRKLTRLLDAFLIYAENRFLAGGSFSFSDCSLGNLLFAGAYLTQQKDFNRAVKLFSELAPLKGRVLNVTDGHNLLLTALKDNGTFLPCEADIVREQTDAVPIREIYLLSSYLSVEEEEILSPMSANHRAGFLNKRQVRPAPNPEALDAIKAADILVYGPGTQHSSLFPSYLTEGLPDAIASNTEAEKIFIGNIRQDYEILGETASSLTRKFLFYMSDKGRRTITPEQWVTTLFIQKSKPRAGGAGDYVFYDQKDFPFPAERVVATDWETEGGQHSGGHVVDELIHRVNSRLNRKLKPFHHRLSIVVPALNEERTIHRVLEDLNRLDTVALGLEKEIIVVDGGSKDATAAIARKIKDVRVDLLKCGSGRGEALRKGIELASGNIIAFFPSDAEYRAADLLPMIEGIVRGNFPVVYGSRAIKCVNLSQQILDIYGGNRLLYLSSKYGGMLISILGLLLYNRFISDPLTGLKAFDARLLKDLKLRANGLDLETELLAKLGRAGTFILEVPVEYSPRTRAQGKKTTLWDGLLALQRLVFSRHA